MRRTCLVLGGADRLHRDIERYTGPIDGVVACNEAGIEWQGELEAWVSLHPRFFGLKGWVQARKDRAHPDAKMLVGHEEGLKDDHRHKTGIPENIVSMRYQFPGVENNSGTSGLFAAKVALCDLGFDRVVLAGIPLDPVPHLHGRTDWVERPKTPEGYRKVWAELPERYTSRMTSMGGWTQVLLGPPKLGD